MTRERPRVCGLAVERARAGQGAEVLELKTLKYADGTELDQVRFNRVEECSVV